MPRLPVLYQCQACGNIMRAHDRRAHLGDRHGPGAEAMTTRQVQACYTRDIDIMHPGRAEKWGYTDEEIGGVIPGLEQTPGTEVSDGATESRPGRV